MEEIENAIARACKELFNVDIEPELTRVSEQFGDYATNVALQIAAKLGNSPAGGPQEIATAITDKLRRSKGIAKIAVASPGFINITLDDAKLTQEVLLVLAQRETYGNNVLFAGKTVVAEYSDPNPFKVLHAGHLYTSVVGDAIANLFEAAGATVHRVNFGGDVGLHVGKTMWAILKGLNGENADKLTEILPAKRAEWMTEAYVRGTKAYDDDEQAKAEIIGLNKRVYQLHADDDHNSDFAKIYWTCREWSYEYFNQFYKRIGSYFEKFYPESEVADLGIKTVKQQLEKGVFEKSDGAVVFKGEPHGLHTRVFITSEGIPTYETKDIGLIMTKWEDYHFDKSVVITGNEQEQYMTVVLKAIEQFAPELAHATNHITHGIVKLLGGVKMSSRKGNILRAVDVLDAAAAANQKATDKSDERVELGAVKYAFLKQRTGGDIIYDPEESVSLQGNSGPYLHYAFARANSILKKSQIPNPKSQAKDSQLSALDVSERSFVKKLSEYPEVIEKAVQELMPHYVCTYLYELAQTFNRFYENNRVLGDSRESVRLEFVQAYSQVLKNGLSVLGITVPEKM